MVSKGAIIALVFFIGLLLVGVSLGVYFGIKAKREDAPPPPGGTTSPPPGTTSPSGGGGDDERLPDEPENKGPLVNNGVYIMRTYFNESPICQGLRFFTYKPGTSDFSVNANNRTNSNSSQQTWKFTQQPSFGTNVYTISVVNAFDPVANAGQITLSENNKLVIFDWSTVDTTNGSFVRYFDLMLSPDKRLWKVIGNEETGYAIVNYKNSYVLTYEGPPCRSGVLIEKTFDSNTHLWDFYLKPG